MTPMIALLTLPLLAALAAIALPRRARAAAARIGAGSTLLAAIWVAVVVWRTGSVEVMLGGWQPPVGIALRADGLSVALGVMTALVMSAAVLAARFEHATTGPGPRIVFGIWPLILLLWAALNAVFVSRDLFNLYVGLELISLSAVALVAISGKAQAVAAGLRYLLFALTGSLLYLAGVVLTYSAHGMLDIDLLAARTPVPTDALALGLMTAGLLAKTALFPFHVWLPPAHAAAPAPASALLSALVPKASLLILVRLWFEAMPDMATAASLLTLGGLGALAVVWGGVLALVQARLKLIVAYSTVAQLGYVFLAFPLAGGAGAAQPWSAGAWTGAMFQILSHGLAKASMFLTAGIFIAAVGSDRLGDLRGLARALPMTGFAFALSAITLMGLPPSGGFTAKYLMMTSAFAADQRGWAAVLVGGGLLAAAYLYRPMAALFSADMPAAPRAVPRRWQAVPLLLAALAVGLGLMSAAPFDLLQIGRPDIAAEGL